MDRNLRCPCCNSLYVKQAYQQQVNRNDTTRQDREKAGWEVDNLQQLYCHPVDSTWYGCVMCNTEFDGEGNEYKIRQMYPFSQNPDGQID